MNKIPESVELCGCSVRIVNRDAGATENMGYCIKESATIELQDTLPHDVVRSTLIHEMLEYINMSAGLKLKHRQIEGLEAALYPFFKYNPNVVGWLCHRT